jgi:hypothetical protein
VSRAVTGGPKNLDFYDFEIKLKMRLVLPSQMVKFQNWHQKPVMIFTNLVVSILDFAGDRVARARVNSRIYW